MQTRLKLRVIAGVVAVLLCAGSVSGQVGDCGGVDFNQDQFVQAGLPDSFVQQNLSGSRYGVLRGLHYQSRFAQGKLVRVTTGKIFDVAVDLRRSSPTFGHSVGNEISSDNSFTSSS